LGYFIFHYYPVASLLAVAAFFEARVVVVLDIRLPPAEDTFTEDPPRLVGALALALVFLLSFFLLFLPGILFLL
jgi:hypothetical protein